MLMFCSAKFVDRESRDAMARDRNAGFAPN
jgi:hypothetical protein